MVYTLNNLMLLIWGVFSSYSDKPLQTSTDITSVSMAMWRKRRLLVPGSKAQEEIERETEIGMDRQRMRVLEILSERREGIK